MFTLVAFCEVDPTAAAAGDLVAAVADEHVSIAGSDIYVPELNQLVGEYCGEGSVAAIGVGISYGYLVSPSLRSYTRQNISPAALHKASPLPCMAQMHPLSPIALVKDEALNGFLYPITTVITDVAIIAAWLADGPIVPVIGDIRTIRCTAAAAGTAGKWTNAVMALAEDLPTGTYQVVGAKCAVTGAVGLFRLMFPAYQWRPGGLVVLSGVNDDIPAFRQGRMGVWGEFTHRNLPRLEVLLTDTVATQVVDLDIVKVG